jgi:hypothetical protein
MGFALDHACLAFSNMSRRRRSPEVIDGSTVAAGWFGMIGHNEPFVPQRPSM